MESQVPKAEPGPPTFSGQTWATRRYGNRWQQSYTGTGSGSTFSQSFNTAANRLSTGGYTYDAAGNMTYDGFNSYTYDAEGNITAVTGNAAATYVYNALNQRVRTLASGATTEFVFNANGQRVSEWNGAHAQLKGKYYWGGTPVAYYTTASSGSAGAHFEHTDWLAAAAGTLPANSSAPFYSNYCWSYDAFGNRTAQDGSSAPFTNAIGAPACAAQSSAFLATDLASFNANNQMTGTNARGVAVTPTYDAAGDVTYDGANQYLYDAEGRLCAAETPSLAGGGPVYTGYFYDAQGTRAAKGSLSSFSCNFASNGFTPTTSYVLGLKGEQVTELSVIGAAGSYVSAWKHANVFDALGLQATYSQTGTSNYPTSTYFALNDWLGTKRAEVGYIVGSNGAPQPCTATFASLPYGDGLTPSGNCPDATEHHFTGKERDAESGNDYFNARYYASAMGRFMSPDPLPWIHWQHGNEDDQNRFEGFIANPQNFNLYAYVNNNPLNKTDPTGMNACGTSNDSSCKVTVTIQDRSKDANGHYNDQFTGVANQQGYNATAVVTVNGKETGTFLVKTTSDDPTKYATLASGTYSGTLTTHNGLLAIRLQPTLAIPTMGENPTRSDHAGGDGRQIAQGILVHKAGIDNATFAHHGNPVSAGCQVVCSSQYGAFERATGMIPSAGAPQHHFTVNVNASANTAVDPDNDQ